jgi:hypothetical protein
MKSKPRILFVGCSNTANSGFKEENRPLYHWPWLLSRHYDCYFQNAAIGGASNDEIFYRTIDAVNQTKFDVVIILWTSFSRKWVYFEDNNVDDFTMINEGIVSGYLPNDKKFITDTYAKIDHAYFNNQYVDLKKWFSQLLTLDSFLNANRQPYIFIKQFDNYITDLTNATYNPADKFSMSDGLKKILDFNNRPDYYILEKLNLLKSLMNSIDQKKWLNFIGDEYMVRLARVDRSDDQLHAGIETNRKLYQALVDYCEKYNIFDNKSLATLDPIKL